MKAFYIVAQKLLTNKWFWVGIGALVLFILLQRNWYKISRLFQRADIDKEEDEKINIPDTVDTAPTGYPYSNKEDIEDLARRFYSTIYGYQGSGTTIMVLEEANKLTDNELKYLSTYYRKYITKDNWLYTDIDDEFLPFNTIDETVMTRLSAVGEKG